MLLPTRMRSFADRRHAVVMRRFVLHERARGATAVEYALLVSLIAVVIVAAVALLGRAVLGLFQGAASI